MLFFRWALETAGLNADELLAVIDKGVETITSIIDDPMQFLDNLITAVKNGFSTFTGNIGEHLQNGLMEWLTGTMGDAGMPNARELRPTRSL